MNFQLLGLSFLSIIILFVFFFLIINYFILLKTNDIKSKNIIFTCRLVNIILILLLIFDPFYEWDVTQSSNSPLDIYLDNSRSMQIISSGINFNNKIQEVIDWGELKKVKVNMYLFGDSLRKYQFNNNLKFSDKSSSFNNILKNINLNKNSNHLIITDGHINKGKIMDDMIIENNNIIIGGVGDSFNESDCYVESVDVKYLESHLVNVAPVIGCNIKNNSNSSIRVVLADYQGNIISSKNISSIKNDGFLDINFKNINTSDCKILNQIIIYPNFEDSNTDNNIKYFKINMKEQLKKVLLLTGSTSNNTRFLKQLISGEFHDVDLKHQLDSESLENEELSEYSLIVLDNFPSKSKHLKYFDNIINNQKDIPVIYFEGPDLSLNIGNHIAKSLNISLLLNDNKNQELLIENNSDICGEIDFNKFSPSRKRMLWLSGNESKYSPITFFVNKEFNVKTISSIKNKESFSAVFIPNMASISLIESSVYNSNNFIDYIYSLITYEYEDFADLIDLNINGIKHPVNNIIESDIKIDKKIVNMTFYMVQVDLNNNISDTLIINNDLLLNPSYEFTINESGVYSVQVIGQDDNSKYKSNEKFIVLSEFDLESQFLHQNKKSIINFIENNNSRYFNLEDLTSNLDNMSINKIFKKDKKNINSLSSQYYWVILILLFLMEWYLRKKSKLL